MQVWQMAENIYNDEEPETPASELEDGKWRKFSDLFKLSVFAALSAARTNYY